MEIFQKLKTDIYWLMIFSLAVSTAAAIFILNKPENLVNVLAAIFTAAVLDLGIKKYWKKENMKFPKSAVISGFYCRFWKFHIFFFPIFFNPQIQNRGSKNRSKNIYQIFWLVQNENSCGCGNCK